MNIIKYSKIIKDCSSTGVASYDKKYTPWTICASSSSATRATSRSLDVQSRLFLSTTRQINMYRILMEVAVLIRARESRHMEYLPTRWDNLLNWWYHRSGLEPREMAHLIQHGFMTRLQFEIPEMIAELYGVHPGELSPDDIARVDPIIIRSKLRSVGEITLACLADVLRFSKRSTPRNWHIEIPRPSLTCGCCA